MPRRFLFAPLVDKLSRSCHAPLPLPAALYSILTFQSKNRMEEFSMATINLREFYLFYTHDYFVEVPDEIAAALAEAERLERNYIRRTFYNKAHFSLDVEDGIETAITYRDRTPWEVVEMAEQHCRLCRALNSLPETQGRRVAAHYILGMSRKEIA
jgi:RNA polymerase sigma-70 factor (ECF subfamily)